MWLLFVSGSFLIQLSFGGAGLSLAGLEKFVEALFFSEAKLGAQPVAGTVDARARNVQAGRYFLSAVLEEDQHTKYHIGVGKRRVIAAQVVDKTRICGKKGSPERPEIIFKSLRTMENVGVNAARHLVSDGFHALKRGIALVEGGTDAGFGRFAARSLGVTAQPDLAGAAAHYNKNGHCRQGNNYECDDSARLLTALGLSLIHI